MDHPKLSRLCAVCGKVMTPFHFAHMVAHEFDCYSRQPERIPPHHRAQFAREVERQRRSRAAFRGVETRRRQGGARAPR